VHNGSNKPTNIAGAGLLTKLYQLSDLKSPAIEYRGEFATAFIALTTTKRTDLTALSRITGAVTACGLLLRYYS
jgi:hypothetical protein